MVLFNVLPKWIILIKIEKEQSLKINCVQLRIALSLAHCSTEINTTAEGCEKSSKEAEI